MRGLCSRAMGRAPFAQGADIGRFPGMLGNATAAAQYARDCARLLVHMDAMRKPVVAALNGMALGGGLELALRCHGIVALSGAVLQFPEITARASCPDWAAWWCPIAGGRMQQPHFHDMIRRAERMPAKTAHALGIVDALAHDHAGLIEAAVARVHALSGRSPPQRFAKT